MGCNLLGVGHEEKGLDTSFLKEDQVGQKPSLALSVVHTEATLEEMVLVLIGTLRGLEMKDRPFWCW